MELDLQGHLVVLRVTPHWRGSEAEAREVDWQALFEAAALNGMPVSFRNIISSDAQWVGDAAPQGQVPTDLFTAADMIVIVLDLIASGLLKADAAGIVKYPILALTTYAGSNLIVYGYARVATGIRRLA